MPRSHASPCAASVSMRAANPPNKSARRIRSSTKPGSAAANASTTTSALAGRFDRNKAASAHDRAHSFGDDAKRQSITHQVDPVSQDKKGILILMSS